MRQICSDSFFASNLQPQTSNRRRRLLKPLTFADPELYLRSSDTGVAVQNQELILSEKIFDLLSDRDRGIAARDRSFRPHQGCIWESGGGRSCSVPGGCRRWFPPPGARPPRGSSDRRGHSAPRDRRVSVLHRVRPIQRSPIPQILFRGFRYRTLRRIG